MKPKDYITVTRGLRGYFAVHVTWSEDGYPEPEQSGVGSYATEREAEVEAKSWAQSEGLEFLAPGEQPRAPARKMTAEEAEALGFTIDYCAAGCWYAYKGPRFAPTEGLTVETENETSWRERAEELETALRPFAEAAARVPSWASTDRDFGDVWREKDDAGYVRLGICANDLHHAAEVVKGRT